MANLPKRLIRQGVAGFTLFVFLLAQLILPIPTPAQDTLRPSVEGVQAGLEDAVLQAAGLEEKDLNTTPESELRTLLSGLPGWPSGEELEGIISQILQKRPFNSWGNLQDQVRGVGAGRMNALRKAEVIIRKPSRAQRPVAPTPSQPTARLGPPAAVPPKPAVPQSAGGTASPSFLAQQLPHLVGHYKRLPGPGEDFTSMIVGQHPFPIRIYGRHDRVRMYQVDPRGYDTSPILNFPPKGISRWMPEGRFQQIVQAIRRSLTFPEGVVFALFSHGSPAVVPRLLRNMARRGASAEDLRLIKSLKPALDRAEAVSPDRIVFAAVSHLSGPYSEAGKPSYRQLVDYVNHVLENRGRNPRISASTPAIGGVEDIDKRNGLDLWIVKEGDITIVFQAQVHLKDGRIVRFVMNVAKDLADSAEDLRQVHTELAEYYRWDPRHVMESFAVGTGRVPSWRGDLEVPVQVGEWLEDFHELHVYEQGPQITVWWDQRAEPGPPLSVGFSHRIWQEMVRIQVLYATLGPEWTRPVPVHVNAGDFVGRFLGRGEDQQLPELLLVWTRGGDRGRVHPRSRLVLNALLQGARVVSEDGSLHFVWWDQPELAIQAVREGLQAQGISEQFIQDLLVETYEGPFPHLLQRPHLLPNWAEMNPAQHTILVNVARRAQAALGVSLGRETSAVPAQQEGIPAVPSDLQAALEKAETASKAPPKLKAASTQPPPLDPRVLDPKSPSFEIKWWVLERYLKTQAPLTERLEQGELTGEEVMAWVEEIIRPLRPDFDPKGTVPSGKQKADSYQLQDLAEEILEQVLIPNGFLLIPSAFRPGRFSYGRILPEKTEVVTSPAGRQVPVYTVRLHTPFEEFGVAVAKTNFILVPTEAVEGRMFLETFRNVKELWRAYEQGLFRPPSLHEDPSALIGWIALQFYGPRTLEEAQRLEREVDLAEELSHSDTLHFLESLWGSRIRRRRPGETMRMAQAILQPQASLRQLLGQRGMDEAMLEIEGKLNALRHSPYPVETFVEFLQGTILPAALKALEPSRYTQAYRHLLLLLSEPLLGEATLDQGAWLRYLDKAVLDIEGWNKQLRKAADLVYPREFLTQEDRERLMEEARGPGPSSTAGLEEVSRESLVDGGQIRAQETLLLNALQTGQPLPVYVKSFVRGSAPHGQRHHHMGASISLSPEPNAERVGFLPLSNYVLDPNREIGPAPKLHRLLRHIEEKKPISAVVERKGALYESGDRMDFVFRPEIPLTPANFPEPRFRTSREVEIPVSLPSAPSTAGLEEIPVAAIRKALKDSGLQGTVSEAQATNLFHKKNLTPQDVVNTLSGVLPRGKEGARISREAIPKLQAIQKAEEEKRNEWERVAWAKKEVLPALRQMASSAMDDFNSLRKAGQSLSAEDKDSWLEAVVELEFLVSRWRQSIPDPKSVFMNLVQWLDDHWLAQRKVLIFPEFRAELVTVPADFANRLLAGKVEERRDYSLLGHLIPAYFVVSERAFTVEMGMGQAAWVPSGMIVVPLDNLARDAKVPWTTDLDSLPEPIKASRLFQALGATFQTLRSQYKNPQAYLEFLKGNAPLEELRHALDRFHIEADLGKGVLNLPARDQQDSFAKLLRPEGPLRHIWDKPGEILGINDPNTVKDVYFFALMELSGQMTKAAVGSNPLDMVSDWVSAIFQAVQVGEVHFRSAAYYLAAQLALHLLGEELGVVPAPTSPADRLKTTPDQAASVALHLVTLTPEKIRLALKTVYERNFIYPIDEPPFSEIDAEGNSRPRSTGLEEVLKDAGVGQLQGVFQDPPDYQGLDRLREAVKLLPEDPPNRQSLLLESLDKIRNATTPAELWKGFDEWIRRVNEFVLIPQKLFVLPASRFPDGGGVVLSAYPFENLLAVEWWQEPDGTRLPVVYVREYRTDQKQARGGTAAYGVVIGLDPEILETFRASFSKALSASVSPTLKILSRLRGTLRTPIDKARYLLQEILLEEMDHLYRMRPVVPVLFELATTQGRLPKPEALRLVGIEPDSVLGGKLLDEFPQEETLSVNEVEGLFHWSNEMAAGLRRLQDPDQNRNSWAMYDVLRGAANWASQPSRGGPVQSLDIRRRSFWMLAEGMNREIFGDSFQKEHPESQKDRQEIARKMDRLAERVAQKYFAHEIAELARRISEQTLHSGIPSENPLRQVDPGTPPKALFLIDRMAHELTHSPAGLEQAEGITVQGIFIPSQGVLLSWYSSELAQDGAASLAWMGILDSAQDRLVVPLADISSSTTVFVEEKFDPIREEWRSVISGGVMDALKAAGVQVERFRLDNVPQGYPERENVFLLDVPIGSEREWVLDPASIVINFRSDQPNHNQPDSPKELGALVNAAREADRRVLQVGRLYSSTDPELRDRVIALDTQL